MSKKYADVVMDITNENLDRAFTYEIPEELAEKAAPGAVVEVPFGAGGRIVRGYVTAVHSQSDLDPAKIKQIAGVLTDLPDAQGRLVALAGAIREHYGSTMAQALRCVFPAKKRVKAVVRKTVVLTVSQEEAARMAGEMRKKHQSARARLLDALAQQSRIPGELIRTKLSIAPAVLRTLEERGIIRIEERTESRNPLLRELREAQGPDPGQITLTEEQRLTVEAISAVLENPGARPGKFLIHGVTGSGKTQVYMELIERVVGQGKQAIMLIPEIALTWQTVMRFYRRFGERVSFIHSRLSAGERYDQFLRACAGEIDVMIGPRSALFTPFPNLGMIVMDEEHEGAYQSEVTPRYHAREVACMRAQMEGAVLILGSATPSMEAMFGAQTGKYRLLRMASRINQGPLPPVEVVDMREELKNGRRSMISKPLQDALEECISGGNQAMLFLNRRGWAGFVSCRSCGHVITCPHCEVSLSLHKNGKMICHYCGYQEDAARECPSCGSDLLRTFRAGTQQIEDEVSLLFPHARMLRMDLDTTRQKDDYARILSSFAAHEADILIGTQMIVKGHDFPNVTLSGILAADLSLFAPDYRAGERTFQLLTQAAGRAGRADKPGRVVIQTYVPDHYVVVNAARQDYDSFYKRELAYRRMGGYPPVGNLLAIHLSCPNPELLERASSYLARFIMMAAEKMRCRDQMSLMGPGDEAVPKIADQFRKIIYIKSNEPRLLTKLRQKAEEYVAINDGFRSVLIQYDFSG